MLSIEEVQKLPSKTHRGKVEAAAGSGADGYPSHGTGPRRVGDGIPRKQVEDALAKPRGMPLSWGI
jgi:hypothetical protein